jgi:hypothetical protein
MAHVILHGVLHLHDYSYLLRKNQDKSEFAEYNLIGDGRCATPPVESTSTRSVRGILKEIEEREEELSPWHTSNLALDTDRLKVYH